MPLIFSVMQILLLRRTAFLRRQMVVLARLVALVAQNFSWKLIGVMLMILRRCGLLMLISLIGPGLIPLKRLTRLRMRRLSSFRRRRRLLVLKMILQVRPTRLFVRSGRGTTLVSSRIMKLLMRLLIRRTRRKSTGTSRPNLLRSKTM